MKSDISSKELAVCAKEASRHAVARAQAMKIPYTVQEGRRIVRRNPDGSKDLLETLPKAFVVPAKKRYKIA